MSELILPKVTVILRGYETKQVLSVVEQLVGTKVNSIEVASNSPHVAESIAAAKKEFGSEVHVGAGTVTTVERAKAATYAGIGSGIFDPADIEECNSANLAASIKNLEDKVNW